MTEIFETVPFAYLCSCYLDNYEPSPSGNGLECLECNKSIDVRPPWEKRLKVLRFNELSRA